MELKIVDIFTKSDERGSLSELKDSVPFQIKKVLYLYDLKSEQKRGGHGHKKLIQFLVCLQGTCEVYVNDGKEEKSILLDSPSKGLVLPPQYWHEMIFSQGAILLALGSMPHDPDDYWYEKPVIGK